MTRVLFILIFIANTVSSMNAEDQAFCTFLAKEVFTTGEYKAFSRLEKNLGKNNLDHAGTIKQGEKVEYERFEVHIAMTEICYIRGNMKGTGIWNTVLKIYFGSTLPNTISTSYTPYSKIIPEESNSVKLELLRYSENVNWSEVAKEFRFDFVENFWKNKTITDTEKKSILEECGKHTITKEIIHCIKDHQNKIQSKKTEEDETNKNIDQQQGEKGKDKDQLKTPENGTFNKDHEDKSKDKNQSTKSENGIANKNQEDQGKDENQLTNMENKTATDEDEEKTIFANPYITWSIIFVLSIGWFFFFKYIRDQCLEEDDDIEYDSEFSYMKKDEDEEWPEV